MPPRLLRSKDLSSWTDEKLVDKAGTPSLSTVQKARMQELVEQLHKLGDSQIKQLTDLSLGLHELMREGFSHETRPQSLQTESDGAVRIEIQLDNNKLPSLVMEPWYYLVKTLLDILVIKAYSNFDNERQP